MYIIIGYSLKMHIIIDKALYRCIENFYYKTYLNPKPQIMPQKKVSRNTQSAKNSKSSSSSTKATANKPSSKAAVSSAKTATAKSKPAARNNKAVQKQQQTTTASSSRKTEAEMTKVVANIDVGWGNKLFVRGQGSGLNWEQGIEMKNTGPREWVWTSSNPSQHFELKFLINDEQWNQGDNLQVSQGSTLTTQPTFN